MVLVQNWAFYNLFFLGSIGQENVLYDILERKNAFLGYKNKTLKNSKNWHFFFKLQAYERVGILLVGQIYKRVRKSLSL